MKKVVISLGGSIVNPDGIDIDFIKKFKKLILNYTANGNKVILVVGGGATARKYIESVKSLNLDFKEKDMLGIMATRINAQLVKSVFGKSAYKDVIYDPTKNKNFRESVLIAAGYKPGYSSDYVAAILARNLNAHVLFNLSNIYYVYDKDPNKYKDAVKIENIDWKGMQKIVGSKWVPGLNLPFDPIASKFCGKNKIEVVITKGTDLVNFKKILDNKKAKATRIK